MSSITEKTYAEQTSIKSVSSFFSRFQIGSLLNRAGARKERGVSVSIIVKYLMALVYTGKSMYQDFRSETPLAQGFQKDAVYRFLNMASVNWQAFLLSVSGKAVASISKLTSGERRTAFVIDDTVFSVLYAKSTELVSKVYDHSAKAYKWGFRLLTLGWTDGATFIPLAFRHLASADEGKRRCGSDPGIDKRSRAHRIRREAVSKSTDVMLMQLKAAVRAGIAAKYVLFDSWFAFPATIAKVCAMHLDVVARVKDTTKITYLVGGQRKTARQIFRENRKRRGKSRYLMSVPVSLRAADEITVPARLVYVRNRQKRNEWIALVSTDMDLTEEEIIALYGKRWDIEVFFKICKSYLKLAKEFQQLSYDAITAHTAIVMLRYIMLSVEKRTMEDPRTLGELFFRGFDEASDIKFDRAVMLLMALLADTLRETDLGLTEEQMGQIMDSFIQKLPYEISRSLQPNLAA